VLYGKKEHEQLCLRCPCLYQKLLIGVSFHYAYAKNESIAYHGSHTGCGLIGFIAGIIYGVIIEFVALKYG